MVANPNEDQSGSNPLAELAAREAIIAENLQGLDTSTKQQAIGEELILISKGKLYKAVGFKSFKDYLEARRNPISRQRAYQLMNFVRRKRACIVADIPIPANERQSRATQASAELSPFEQRWTRVFSYLKKKFLECPPSERGRFAEMLKLVAPVFGNWSERLNSEQKSDETQESAGA